MKNRRTFRLNDTHYDFLLVLADEDETLASTTDALRMSIIHYRRHLESEADGQLDSSAISGVGMSVWEPPAIYRTVARLAGVAQGRLDICKDQFIENVMGRDISSVMAEWKAHCKKFADSGDNL